MEDYFHDEVETPKTELIFFKIRFVTPFEHEDIFYYLNNLQTPSRKPIYISICKLMNTKRY